MENRVVSIDLMDTEKTREAICVSGSSRDVGPKSPFIGDDCFSKSPRNIVGRGKSKISKNNDRCVFGSAIGDQRNMEICHRSLTPRIVVDPGSPRCSKSSCWLRHDGEPADEDEYLTAESDVEEFEDTNDGPGEPVASSSERLDMSTIAFHHEQWLQAYKKLSNCKPVCRKYTSKAGEKKRQQLCYENKLEKHRLRELQQKREKCFNSVDQLLEINSNVASMVDDKSVRHTRPSCDRTMEFIKTLRACSEYLTFAKSTKENSSRTLAGPSVAAGADGSSIVSGSNKKKLNSSIRGGTRRSPGRSLTKKTLRVVSPGLRYPSPRGKIKRRSLKIGSPMIDKTSIRPVEELRIMFSPRLRAIADRESTAKAKNVVPKTIATIVPSTGSRLQITPGTATSKMANKRKLNKFGHVVSPVACYIKGDANNN